MGTRLTDALGELANVPSERYPMPCPPGIEWSSNGDRCFVGPSNPGPNDYELVPSQMLLLVSHSLKNRLMPTRYLMAASHNRALPTGAVVALVTKARAFAS